MFTAEQLLIPISSSNPSGIDISFSPELDAIAQARKFDDPSLAQGEWVTELKEADWEFVVQRCVALLTQQSKDLKVAVWLTEAAAKQYHLRGLGEGFRLLAGLCEQYWDLGLYPQADDGDQEQRIGNLSWILSRTRSLVREIPLTEGRHTAWSTVDFEAARKRASAGQETDGQPKLADMEAAKRATSASFVAAFNADAQYCLDALRELERVSDAKLGHDSPGFSAARDALEGMLHAMPAVAASPAAQEAAATPAGTDAGSATASTPAQQTTGPIRTRAQAIAQLRDVARFFRETEPHSPVSYFAEKAANAGEQDLHTWLRSVIKDQGSLAHIEELLGVPPSN
ncbi:type VI secretion system protein ImpA [Pseudoduganella flava]|uniref:Type VI secretion system protein ImpA n=1 Tax=Pseudoduganella flava TaxID=871742 RepID=A0A562PHW1_9BURK|nr:type VI secretion system protein TssA [Pseudoduganella flava]QGZ37669.1 type VI secretion system protein TssA [Pseudoduganella flava]TWI43968.1 type VI secretion system protein ImpA [Pseudoduganella flava]